MVTVQALNEEGAQNADWAKAYAGDDTDGTPGCRTLAFKSITETADLRAQEAYSAIAPSIIGVLNGRSALQASSELQTATTSWSSCMADLGFAYESPQYAAAEFLDQPGTPPSDREVGVSKADIECRSESRYQEILLTAYAGLARTWTKENEGQVAELSQLAKRDIQAMKQLLQVSE